MHGHGWPDLEPYFCIRLEYRIRTRVADRVTEDPTSEEPQSIRQLRYDVQRYRSERKRHARFTSEESEERKIEDDGEEQEPKRQRRPEAV